MSRKSLKLIVLAALVVLSCKKEPSATSERVFYCASSQPRECLPTKESCEKPSEGGPRKCFESPRAFCFSVVRGDIKNPDRRESLCFVASDECASLSKSLTLLRRAPTSCSESLPQEVWP